MNVHEMGAAMQEKPEKRTTLHLSVTQEDKRALKMLAIERDTSASALLHEWIERERVSEKSDE